MFDVVACRSYLVSGRHNKFKRIEWQTRQRLELATCSVPCEASRRADKQQQQQQQGDNFKAVATFQLANNKRLIGNNIQIAAIDLELGAKASAQNGVDDNWQSKDC
ncbi:hypothetical protein ACLKA7_017217 [Drosophila subpalustris]